MIPAIAKESDSGIAHKVARFPKGSGSSIAGRRDYESLIQKVLKDRSGRRTWADLERLEKESERNPAVRKALTRLDALYQTGEFQRKGASDDPATLAATLDGSDRATQHECWAKMWGGERTEALKVLRRSRSGVGGQSLGLPPRFGKTMETAARGSLENVDNWDRLLEGSLRTRLKPGSEDPRLKEYGKLYRAYRQAQQGRLNGKVSEVALYLDVKQMEDSLLPEHVRKARQDIKSKLLGGRDDEPVHPRSKTHQLLGQLSAMPSNSRERFLYTELSSVAINRPKELPFYAQNILEEIRRCPESVSARFLPKFRRALARVKRVHASHVNGLDGNKVQQHDVPGLLRALAEDAPGSGAAHSEEIEYYRSKLTVNGYVRNYTYL